ncbi:MAG: RNA polymerase sigma factor [Roseiflexaceae bacterium]|nr:RNA polymerase sigma factor [Roseiflexaceae bacterium]
MVSNQGTPTADAEIAELYTEYGGALLAHLRRLVSDREVAEDLCHETFIKALRSWHQRDQQGNAAAWLYRIATNTAYDHLRRRRRIQFTPLLDETSIATDRGTESRFAEQEPVHRALAQMPAIYRLPLIMHSCSGHSTQEIATKLGCSNSAVKTRLFRARERFREVYQA